MNSTTILRLWARLAHLPGGRWLFSRLLGRAVPYTGALGAVVSELDPGRARVVLTDRRRVRNHLHSIHAIALANLGEMASGLAMLTALDSQTRAIVTAIDIRYHKKARGPLTALGTAAPPAVVEQIDSLATADITDESGDSVASVTVTWRLEPVALS